MSAAERSDETSHVDGDGQPAPDATRRAAQRRAAERRRHLTRVDLGLGVVGAVVLILATPGLAITALVALIVLIMCLVTFVAERRGWSLRGRLRRRRPRAR
jgi:hypothetical protein